MAWRLQVALLLLMHSVSTIEGGALDVWPLPANTGAHRADPTEVLMVPSAIELSVASSSGHHAENRTDGSSGFTDPKKLDVLSRALLRYKYLLHRLALGAGDRNDGPERRLLTAPNTLHALEVSVQHAEADTPLGLEMDESYTLTVKAPRATLAAPSVWGALRGLETFSQVSVPSPSTPRGALAQCSCAEAPLGFTTRVSASVDA
jgi:hypothetical protein